ncbi:MAG: carbohydrate porin [Terriglobales bacterium]
MGAPTAAAQFRMPPGINFSGFLQLDGSTVASGGQVNPLAFDGQYLLDVAVHVDTKKLIGWPGGTFMVDAQTHSGPSILTHQMPALQDPDNMDAHTETSVDRAWYHQDLLHQALQLQLGLMYVDGQFFTVPFGDNFISLDFSSDASVSTFILPTYPKGSFGGDVFVYPGHGLYASAGIFNDHSTELSYDPGGDLELSEEGWQSSWKRLPWRHLKVQLGAWRDTGRFRPFTGGVQRGRVSGVYAVESQQLWQPAGAHDRGLSMFFQFGTGPPSVAAAQRHFGGGLVWTGPLSARPHDQFGIAFSDSQLSRQNSFAYGFESETEAYYQIAVGSKLTVQPDVEYWLHPSGMQVANTVLLLTRVVYTF